jgi:hypothetical protein
VGIFHTGIAYPIRARLSGEGVGAVRTCEFSTGAFVEPITVWDPPRHLAFNVVEQPPSMHESSPFARIEPAHVRTGFVSQRGQFQLRSLGSHRTELSGTTWYRLNIFPTAYWQLYADAIVHQIHSRVLEHIRTLSQAEQS